MSAKNGFCKRAEFEQGKAEDNGIGYEGKNRACKLSTIIMLFIRMA